MTTTDTAGSTEQPPPPSEPRSPRLERTARYRGVCRALARTTGTDVTLWNVLFIVLAFFNGVGLLLYMLCLVLIPEQGQPASLGRRLVHGPNRHLEGSDILILVVLGLTAASFRANGDGFTIVVLVAFGLLVFSNGRGLTISIGNGPRPPAPAPAPLVQPYAPLPPIAPVRRHHRSALTALTLGAALLVAGLLVLLDSAEVPGLRAEVVLAAALGVVGLGLVVGAWWGRSRALVPVAILLGIALLATSAGRPALDHGVGQRTWAPGAGAAGYDLGVGEATLDLRRVPLPDGNPVIDARVDIGHLVVLIPPDLPVAVHARAELGDVNVLGTDQNGRQVEQDVVLGPEAGSTIDLELSVRVGQVEVRRG